MSDTNETRGLPALRGDDQSRSEDLPSLSPFSKKMVVAKSSSLGDHLVPGVYWWHVFSRDPVDGLFGPNDKFANYRDEISVVNSEQSWRIGGSNLLVTVVGTLTNHSNISWKDVGVEARFLDKSGKLIDAITVNADDFHGVTILPHGEAAFKIEGRAARPQSDYANCKVSVRWAKETRAFP